MRKDLLTLLAATILVAVASTGFNKTTDYYILLNNATASELNESQKTEEIPTAKHYGPVQGINLPPKEDFKQEQCNPTPENLSNKVARWKNIVDEAYSEIQPTEVIDKCFIYAMIESESNGYNGIVSSAGAIGLMQLLPSTGRNFGARNLYNP